jgi:hypothetical protein
MDPCCNDIIGGEIYIRARFNNNAGAVGDPGSPVVTYEGMGDVRIQPSGVSRTAGATTGGSEWITEQARPVRLLMNYANRCEHDPMRLFMERCEIDITVVERTRGIWHRMTHVKSVGDVEKNLSTGEITGIELITGVKNYKVKRNGSADQTAGLLMPPQA